MKKLFWQFVICFIFFISLESLNAQTRPIRNKIFPYIFVQASSGDTSICVLKDDLRIGDPNRFFSVFLLYGERVIDSLSLDSFTISAGAKPKNLFLWKTKGGKHLAVLEYFKGGGNGVEIVTLTELLIFDLSMNKLRLLGNFNTDSIYYNNRKREKDIFEVVSRVDYNLDTLHIFREGWKIKKENKMLIKEHKFDLVTYIYWTGKKLISEISSKFSYFLREW